MYISSMYFSFLNLKEDYLVMMVEGLWLFSKWGWKKHVLGKKFQFSAVSCSTAFVVHGESKHSVDVYQSVSSLLTDAHCQCGYH